MAGKKFFDREYSTSYIKEKKYLDSIGIKYSFVKVVDGITIYKYEKTSELFRGLFLFYEELK